MPREKIKKKPDFSLVYPGIFKPAGVIGKSFFAKSSTGIKKIKPAVSMNESPDDISIQLIAPGFRREDFVVTVNNCRLSIAAVHRKLFSQGVAENASVEYNYYFRRKMQLPEHVDPDFVSAEYRDGILSLRFLKSYQACESKRHHVAVY